MDQKLTSQPQAKTSPSRALTVGDIISDRLLRLADVEKLTALGRSTIYRKMDDNQFPKPVQLGSGVRWRLSEIENWMKQLPVVS